MKRTFPIVLSLWLAAAAVTAQAQLRNDTVQNRFLRQLVAFPQEKIHLHLDKPEYFAGEAIWLRAYVVHATFHTPSSMSRYVYADLVNPLDSVVARIMLRPQDGAFYGNIPLDKSLPEGDYTLRAYTSYMASTQGDYLFSRSVAIRSVQSLRMRIGMELRGRGDRPEAVFTVSDAARDVPVDAQVSVYGFPAQPSKTDKTSSIKLSADVTAGARNILVQVVDDAGRKYEKFMPLPREADQFDISLLPEGGNLCDGQMCRVAFKAVGSDGRGRDAEIFVVGSSGDTLVTAASTVNGMGSFSFTPEAGEVYSAVCRVGTGSPVRKTLPAASPEAVSLAVSQLRDKVLVRLLTGSHADTDSLLLVAHLRGAILYSGYWDASRPQMVFDKAMFPSGVVQFLLLDSRLRPLSERLSFFTANDWANANLQTNQPMYKPRTKVSATLAVRDAEGLPLSGGCSVSVVDASLVPADSNSCILSSLLLCSELRGRIESPATYFDPDNPLAQIGLDLVMMTHGWRRYDIPAVLRGETARPQTAPETACTISGEALGGFSYKTPAAGVDIMVIESTGKFLDQTSTDKQGRFAFRDIEFADSTAFLVQALKVSGGDRLQLNIDRKSFPAASNALPSGDWSSSVPPDRTRRQLLGSPLDPVVELESVTVTASTSRKSSMTDHFVNVRSFTGKEILDLNFSSIIDFLTYYLNVSPEMTYRNLPVFIVVDEFPQDDPNSFMPTSDQVNTLDFVLDSYAASFYGGFAQEYGATVIITTLAGRNAPPKPKYNMTFYTPLGYQKPVEFYAPSYELIPMPPDTPDRRTTIYWNPDLRLDAEGRAGFDFWTADGTPSRYEITVEGVSSSGKIIRTTGQLEVK